MCSVPGAHDVENGDFDSYAENGLDLVFGATRVSAEIASTHEYAPKVQHESPAKGTALAWIDAHQGAICDLGDEVWDHAELSLREWHSSIAVAGYLRRHGFAIEWGTAGFPTAFVATFVNGDGGPTLGFSGEYDALPGLSQHRGVSIHDPVEYVYDPFAPTYGPGHGCGHCALGAASAGAAVAVARGLRKHRINTTLRYFGSTAEEQLLGKAYAVREGVYRGIDVMLDWHPGFRNTTGWGTNLALKSATFTFLGQSGHGGSPLGNRSALDAAVLMSTMSEYLREERVGPTGRFHSVINNGGAAPNVTPDNAEISFYVREASPARVQVLFTRIIECAKAASLATETTMRFRTTAACWNVLPSRSGAELIHENMIRIGAPLHTEMDQQLGRRLQESLGLPQLGMATGVADLQAPQHLPDGGSTDVGDISWTVPTLRFTTALAPIGAKMHNWAITSIASAPAGHKALVAGANYLAATAIDLVTQPQLLSEIRNEFAKRTAGIKWASALPKTFQPPMYEPPVWFLKRTNQTWPPSNIEWPPPRVVSSGGFASLGPSLGIEGL